MKRYKTIGILLGVLVVLLVATLIVMNVQNKKEQIKATGETILSVDADDINTLSWTQDDVSLAYHRDDSGNWIYDEDVAFPVDQNKMADLLSTFEQFGASFIIEDVEDYSQYGLSNPTFTIEFSTDSKDYRMELGDYSVLDAQRYISIGDGNVYLATEDPSVVFSIELKDTILNDTIPSLSDASEITFKGNSNYTISRVEDSTGSYDKDDVYFTEVGGKSVPLDTTLVDNYLSYLSNLGLEEYVSYNASDSDLQDCYLKDPDLTITVVYTESDDNTDETSKTFTLSISQNPEEAAAKKKAEENEEEYDGTVSCYARVGDSKIIYKIDENDYDNLMAASYNDLRHRNLMTADFDSINMIDISMDGNTYTITSSYDTKDKDSDRLYYYNEEEIDITNLRSKINALSVSDFGSSVPGKEEITVTLYLDDENHPELTLSFYRLDGDNCVAMVNGSQVGLISRSSVVDLVEAVNSIILK